MDVSEDIACFVRVERKGAFVVVSAHEIIWPTPCTPDGRWHELERLPIDGDDETLDREIAAARERAFSNRRFFLVCGACKRRLPKGWMFADDLCQSCATDLLGVVY